MSDASAPAVKVSVLVMTYNHVKFIRHALDTALMQKTSFSYEVLVSEDCSIDGTREIVIEYQKRFPDKVRLLLSDKNLRSNAVVTRGIEASRGEFIAMLDGDDYWTSELKLQKQVDFLESHPGFTACFHNAIVVGDDKPRNWTPPTQPETMTIEDIWRGNPFATCSTMFRRGPLGKIPSWYESMFPITDWQLHILNAERGKLGYLNEVMGAYRLHSGGLYSARSEMQKLDSILQFYRTMNANFGYRYDATVKDAIFMYFLEWAEEYVQRGDRDKAKFCVRKCFAGRPRLKKICYKRLFRTWKKAQFGLS